jgi:hypothetical protein
LSKEENKICGRGDFVENVIVRIVAGHGASETVVVRDTESVVRLEGKDYSKYRIVQPRGFEDEEILHRPDRGPEALLAVVFVTLAEAGRARSAAAAAPPRSS